MTNRPTTLHAERGEPPNHGPRGTQGITKPLQSLLAHHPELAPIASDLSAAFEAIVATQERAGSLYLCGNGGSMADALHVSAELLKSYTLPRPLNAGLRARLA
jgi:D-sedoheptulose 7-phosphate isomerase